MFSLPGIVNTVTPKNNQERVVTDATGNFEVPVSEPFIASAGYYPNVEVMISIDNGAETERILFDKVGLMSAKRDIGGGMSQLFWGNKADSPHGFLIGRGSYTLRSFIDGKQVKAYKLISETHPYRDDWERFTWTSTCLAVCEESTCTS